MLSIPIICFYRMFFKVSTQLLYISSKSNMKLATFATIWEISGERRKNERETSTWVLVYYTEGWEELLLFQ